MITPGSVGPLHAGMTPRQTGKFSLPGRAADYPCLYSSSTKYPWLQAGWIPGQPDRADAIFVKSLDRGVYPKDAPKTSKGIGLGMPVREVYRAYGKTTPQPGTDSATWFEFSRNGYLLILATGTAPGDTVESISVGEATSLSKFEWGGYC